MAQTVVNDVLHTFGEPTIQDKRVQEQNLRGEIHALTHKLAYTLAARNSLVKQHRELTASVEEKMTVD